MPIHSLPTELVQEIVDLVDSDYPMLGDSWQFGRTITQVSRLWQPMGRRIIWKERVLGLAEDDSVQLDRHLDSFPHLADIVQVLYAYKSDPTDSARALPWSDSQMGALHSILRRCQNLYSVKLRFIADNGNYGPVKVDIVQPFYDLFESASKLPKLERFEIFWPEITMKSFDDILVSGFPALRELKLSIGQFSGLDFLGDGLEESTSTRTRTVVRSPLEILTVTLGGDPGGICRTLRQAIDPSTLAELYVSGNGIANYDKLVPFISSFPSLERLSLSLRGAQQREILPALSTAITPLENLTHVLIRRNWDKFDRSESQGEYYWSPINLRELLDGFPFSMSTFILEGLVFAPDQIDPVVFIEESSQLPPSYCSFFGQVVGEEEECHDFHMILSAPTDGDDEEEYESEWRFVINVGLFVFRCSCFLKLTSLMLTESSPQAYDEGIIRIQVLRTRRDHQIFRRGVRKPILLLFLPRPQLLLRLVLITFSLPYSPYSCSTSKSSPRNPFGVFQLAGSPNLFPLFPLPSPTTVQQQTLLLLLVRDIRYPLCSPDLSHFRSSFPRFFRHFSSSYPFFPSELRTLDSPFHDSPDASASSSQRCL